ncbi:MAG: glycosyltransferase family 4 protein [Candidatus Parvarchaeota archaeon]
MSKSEKVQTTKEVKNIAIFTGSSLSYFGGGERYVVELSNELINRGFNVTIFTQNYSSRQNKSISDVKKNIKAKVIIYPVVPFPFGPTLPIFSRFIMSELRGTDIIYNIDESLFTNFLLYKFSEKSGAKYIYGMHTPMSFLFENKGAKNKITRFMWLFYRYPLRMFFRSKIKNIHVLNEEQFTNLKKIGFSGNIYKIPNFVYDTEAPIELKRISNEFIVIFTALMDVYVKGIDLLKDIIALTLKVEPNIKFYITGSEGNAHDILSSILNKYPNNVRYFGFVNNKELNNLRNKASLCILTSRIESFSLSILESQIHGLPCVAFDISGPSEIVKEEFQGKLIRPYDIVSFAEAIIFYYREWRDNKMKYVDNMRVIHEYVKRNFSKNEIIPRILNMFNSCI